MCMVQIIAYSDEMTNRDLHLRNPNDCLHGLVYVDWSKICRFINFNGRKNASFEHVPTEIPIPG